ncbi:MAG TPA: hypothetical protein VNJ51_06020 [Candidatus Dormibacteraeota bacterium]|nr:hypothetical protein [Candidatus Dormibacteraeota bacterium]
MNAELSPHMERSGVIRPHRSHRTLRVTPAGWIFSALTLVLGLIVTYVALRQYWPWLMEGVNAVLASSGVSSAPVADRFLGISASVPVPLLPSLSVTGSLWVAAACAVLMVLGALVPNRRSPFYYWLGANLFVLMLTALFAFFVGRLAYDGATFMLLVERTSLLMILCAPIFSGIVSVLLPFSVLERLSLLVFTVVLDVILSLVRIAAFSLLVARFGAIAEANLYLFLGPLMDAAYFIGVYSVVVVSLGRRLNADLEAWEWL